MRIDSLVAKSINSFKLQLGSKQILAATTTKVFTSNHHTSPQRSSSSKSTATASIPSLLQQQSKKDVRKTFKNLIQWIVAEDMAFTSIKSLFF